MRAFDRLIDEAPGPHEAIIAIAGEQGRDEHPPTCLRRAPILVNSEEALGDEREERGSWEALARKRLADQRRLSAIVDLIGHNQVRFC